MSCLIISLNLLFIVALSSVAFGAPGNCPICPSLHLATTQAELPQGFEGHYNYLGCGTIKPMNSDCKSEIFCSSTYNFGFIDIWQYRTSTWVAQGDYNVEKFVYNFTCTSNGWIDEMWPTTPLQSTLILCVADLAPNTTKHICSNDVTPSPTTVLTTTPTTSSPSTIAPTTSKSVSSCDDGWTYYDATQSCYKTINNCIFANCENQCQGMGAHLASIHSADENKFVNDLAASGTPQWNFNQTTIGMKVVGGKWIWTDGTPFDYKNWAKGQPDSNLGKQWCGITYADIPSQNYWNLVHYSWDDVECNIPTRAAVCKKSANTQ